MIGMSLVHSKLSPAIPIRMRKVKDESALSLHFNVCMTANRVVVSSFTRFVEDVRLPLPGLSVRRPIDSQPGPDIDYHPVAVAPKEDIRTFVCAISDHWTADRPVVQIVTVRRPGM